MTCFVTQSGLVSQDYYEYFRQISNNRPSTETQRKMLKHEGCCWEFCQVSIFII